MEMEIGNEDNLYFRESLRVYNEEATKAKTNGTVAHCNILL